MAATTFTIPRRVWLDGRFRGIWAARDNKATWVHSEFRHRPYSPELNARRTLRNRFRKILKKLFPAVAGRDGKRCAHCGRSRGVELRLDHVLPLAWGGTNDVWNLQVLCHRCNTMKGDRLPVPPRPSPTILINLLARTA